MLFRSVSQSRYPMVTESIGSVVLPFAWFKFDSAGCKVNSGTTTQNLIAVTLSPQTEAACSTTSVKRGDSSLSFLSGSKTNLRLSATDAATWDLPAKQSANGITLSFWARIATSTPTSGVVFSHVVTTSDDSGIQTSGYFALYRIATANVEFKTGSTTYTATNNFVDGSWHHYAWSIDTGLNSNNWRIWMDGSAIVCPSPCATSRAGAIPTKSSGQSYTFRFGSDATGISFLDGNIDDFRVYTRVLSSSHVKTLFQGRAGLYTAQFGACPDSGTCTSSTLPSKHCDKFGAMACCGPGNYMLDGQDTACQPCPVGTFSEDDPELDFYKEMEKRKLARLTILPKLGCESLADQLYRFVNGVYIPDYWGPGEAERLWCFRVEVRETQANMAYREGHREWNEDLLNG